jgi:hypothetical protein
VTRRPIVVTALPLRRTARQRLGELLEATVVDMRSPIDQPDLVLTPACSPQLLGALKRRFGGAPVVVVEVSDWDLDIEIVGPVKRILASGADAYVLADSIDELAQKLTGARATAAHVPWTQHELEGPTMDDLIAAFLDEAVSYAQRRQRQPSSPR